MKQLLLFALSLLFAGACGDAGKPAANAEPAAAPIENADATNVAGTASAADSAAIAEALHAFFGWYNANQERLSNRFDFIDTGGKRARLKEAQLTSYANEFKASNVVSQEFVENELKFYRAAEKMWQTEDPEEVLSGVDADKYYCAQDWDAAEFTTAPVRATIKGDRATVALLLDPNGNNGGERDFELKKENGRWLLTKTRCDMGVEE